MPCTLCGGLHHNLSACPWRTKTMTKLDIIMARAHALLPAATSTDPDAYDNAMQALENEIRRALGAHACDPVDQYVGLPINAVMEGATFAPFKVPDEPVRLHPDMVQMMDDMAGFGVGVRHERS